MSDGARQPGATGDIGERVNHTRNPDRPAVSRRVARLFQLLWGDANSFQIAAALEGKVSPAHVRQWRNGARPIPDWLRDIAAERAALITDLLSEIPRGPGQRAGDKNLIRNLKAWRAARDAQRD